MPYKKEEDDDLFDDDFEFVDDEDDDDEEDSELEDEDDDSEVDEEEEEEEAPPTKPKRGVRKTAAPAEPIAAPKGRDKPAPRARGKAPTEKALPAPPADDEEVAEEDVPQPVAEPVGPPADHVVHVYEFRAFKRTIARDFTSDDADKFAAEYNRTSANHSRWAVSGNKSDQPTPKI